jgi:hypothetical protein
MIIRSCNLTPRYRHDLGLLMKVFLVSPPRLPSQSPIHHEIRSHTLTSHAASMLSSSPQRACLTSTYPTPKIHEAYIERGRLEYL